MLKIKGDMIQNIKKWSLKKVVYLSFLNVKNATSFISQKFNQYWTYRDLPHTKLTEISRGFWCTLHIWDSCMAWGRKSNLTETNFYARHILAWWIIKKCTPWNWIICLNQRSYLKSVKFTEILIKFPLIWYIVGLCRPNIGIKFVIQTKLSTFLRPPPYSHVSNKRHVAQKVNTTGKEY